MIKLAEKKKASLANLGNSSSVSLRGSLAPKAATPEPARELQTEVSLVSAFVEHLNHLGIEQAFGVSGGAIALLFDALVESNVELNHFRHETGAAFAATEANFASRKPTMVFATTGPGVLNAMTGMTAARWDGAKVVLVSGATTSPQRGRHATQETSSYTMPQDVLYGQGAIFDFAIRMEQASELPEVVRRLSLGLSRPGGFVAHVCLPMGLQSKRLDPPRAQTLLTTKAPSISREDVALCADLLKEGDGTPGASRRPNFVIWAGFGATEAAPRVVELAERSGARVMCSPRAKGVVPENHPNYLGVTGLGGHDSVIDYIVQERPDRILVLGTKLGEATSFWDQDLVPPEGFIHVDVDPDVPGTAYPDSPTLGIHAEIGRFLEALIEHFPERSSKPIRRPTLDEGPIPLPVQGRQPVRPQVLMNAVQRRVVQTSDATVLAECGNSFAWCNHHLRFADAGRYRVSTLFGSMGHAAAGVVGAALARGGKAVAVVGDGSMLMNSELSTAAQYQAQAVWIVLNDSGYGMCRDGHGALGLTCEGVDFQQVDFAGLARSVGADGTTVDREEQLDAALDAAMQAEGPFVVDVRIDTSESSPLLKRFESLIKQGNSKNVAGWEKT